MNKSILLVEDDSFLIDIYTIKFKESGFSIRVATNHDQCFEKIEEEMPDIILLDIVLPSVCGIDILKEIRAKKEYDDIKVIILSNLGQKEEIKEGIKLGAEKYLIKADNPPSQVVKEVEEILK
jgi:DNA-binding response OmpR family regulator